nr:hypothetical protein [Acetobacter papayae]
MGALVTANQTQNLAVITRLDPIYVDVNLPAITLLRLRRELADGRIKPQADGKVPVTVTMEDGSTFNQTGRMALAEVNVNTSTSTVIVRASCPTPTRCCCRACMCTPSLTKAQTPTPCWCRRQPSAATPMVIRRCGL